MANNAIRSEIDDIQRRIAELEAGIRATSAAHNARQAEISTQIGENWGVRQAMNNMNSDRGTVESLRERLDVLQAQLAAAHATGTAAPAPAPAAAGGGAATATVLTGTAAVPSTHNKGYAANNEHGYTGAAHHQSEKKAVAVATPFTGWTTLAEWEAAEAHADAEYKRQLGEGVPFDNQIAYEILKRDYGVSEYFGQTRPSARKGRKSTRKMKRKHSYRKRKGSRR